jgi:hypothetical protein
LNSLDVLELGWKLLLESSRRLTDLTGLQGLVALRELILCNITAVTSESFVELDRLLSGLHRDSSRSSPAKLLSFWIYAVAHR